MRAFSTSVLSRGLEGNLAEIDLSRCIVGRGSTETPTNGLSKSWWTRNFHSYSYGRWGIVPSTQPKMMFRLQPESFGSARETGQPKIDWGTNDFTM